MYLGGNRRWVPLYHCSFSEGDLVEQTKIALSAIKPRSKWSLLLILSDYKSRDRGLQYNNISF